MGASRRCRDLHDCAGSTEVQLAVAICDLCTFHHPLHGPASARADHSWTDASAHAGRSAGRNNRVMSMLLSMQNLSKAFGGLEVVRELSFDVPERTATALIGPNGAGKTTVFNLISGVYPVTSGSIRFRGSDIVNFPSRYRIKRGIARSFQNIRLIPRLSVIDNLLIGQHVTLTRPFDVMRPFRLVRDHEWICAAKAELSAFGLGQYADEPVGLLPYGIRKRVDLIRATLSSPSVLMLDEPAAGLNASETRELHSHLDTLKERGVTLLVIEHDMQFIRSVCEKIVVLNFGCKIAEGSFDQVRTDEQVREAYLGAEQAA